MIIKHEANDTRQGEDANLKRIRELEEELERHKKKARIADTAERAATTQIKKVAEKAKASIISIAQEYTCPISHELMLDPVTAEDGFQYEREKIEKRIKTLAREARSLRSPKTGMKMGKKLLPAVSVKNTIEHLVDSGVIDGELACKYKKRRLVSIMRKRAEDGDIDAMRFLSFSYKHGVNGLPQNREKAMEWSEKATDANHVLDLKTKASERGDVSAMYTLGGLYIFGQRGLEADKKEAFRWYKKSADLRHPRGMALAGQFLLCGMGEIQRNKIQGMSLISMAANLGSDHACWNLGRSYQNGLHGMPKEKEQAKYWLGKCTDGSCVYKHLGQKDFDRAKVALMKLESGSSS